MTLIQQHQSDLEDEQPLVKKLNSKRSSRTGENDQTLKEMDDSKDSRQPLLGGYEKNEREIFDDENDSEEEIDTQFRNSISVNANEEMNKREKMIAQYAKVSDTEKRERTSCDRVLPDIDNDEDDSGNNRVLASSNSFSSQKSLSKPSSKNELCRMQSIDQNIETLEKKRETGESSFIATPPSQRKNDFMEPSESNEESRLLQPLRPMSTSNGYGATTEDADDADSVHSVFRGALDIDVLEIPWESDISRVVDVQACGEEWQTNINPVEGGLRVDGWESNIIEMSKGEDKFGPDIWSIAIHELPKNTQLHEEWGTEIAGRMTNDADPFDWSTKFNKIAKVEERENIWTSKMRKIQNRSAETEQWKSTFNAIGNETSDDIQKTKWKIKIPKRMKDLSLKSDWNTKINHTERSREGEVWKNKFSKILLRCDDRKTHWKTKFFSIQKSEDHLSPWETTFREIAPREMGEPEIWTTAFYSISEEKDLPEHWNTTFTRIEHPIDEHDWSVTIEDIPDDFRDPSDWVTGFNTIENHEKNALWDTSFNSITKDHASESIWTTNFLQADITDISRHDWETNLNAIDKADITWEVSVNPIANHPTNNPVDRG